MPGKEVKGQGWIPKDLEGCEPQWERDVGFCREGCMGKASSLGAQSTWGRRQEQEGVVPTFLETPPPGLCSTAPPSLTATAPLLFGLNSREGLG